MRSWDEIRSKQLLLCHLHKRQIGCGAMCGLVIRAFLSFVELDNDNDWADVGRHPWLPDQESERDGACRSCHCAFCWDLGLLGGVPLGTSGTYLIARSKCSRITCVQVVQAVE